jgi:hypothetical protein
MKRTLLASWFGWLLLLAACGAQAHELRPGVLELREGQPGIYSLLWKRPAGGEVEIRIAPVLPAECRAPTPGATLLTPGALVVRGSIRCDGGIRGRTIVIDGLEPTLTDVLVRVYHADGWLETHLLKPMTT